MSILDNAFEAAEDRYDNALPPSYFDDEDEEYEDEDEDENEDNEEDEEDS